MERCLQIPGSRLRVVRRKEKQPFFAQPSTAGGDLEQTSITAVKNGEMRGCGVFVFDQELNAGVKIVKRILLMGRIAGWRLSTRWRQNVALSVACCLGVFALPVIPTLGGRAWVADWLPGILR